MGSSVQADILVFAVSGFLGQGSDWNIFKSNLSSEFAVKTIDLFAPGVSKNTHANNFDFTGHLIEEIQTQSKNYKRKIYLGYSFGGRLGLKIMQKNADLFDHWVFVSTGVGLLESQHEERALRLAQDQQWAEKISSENWDSFLNEWNSQAVFKDSITEPTRLVSQYDLRLLKGALVAESLAFQPDFRSLVKTNKSKISWLVGRNDKKYLNMAEELFSLDCLVNFDKLSGSHRLTFDAPIEIAQFFNNNLVLK